MEEKTSSKLKSMLDSKKIRNIIIVVGFIGIGLIFLSNWVDFGSLTSGKGEPHSRSRLPNIRKPTSETDIGAMKPAMIVTMMGKQMRSERETCLGL